MGNICLYQRFLSEKMRLEIDLGSSLIAAVFQTIYHLAMDYFESLNIGVAQIANSTDLEKNFKSIDGFLSLFEKEKVDVVLFPECSLSGFSSKIKECSLEVLGPYLDKIHAWSKRTGVHTVLPTAFVKEGRVYNSGYWFHKEGSHQFYKMGLTESEKPFFSTPTKEDPKVISVKNFNLAILICFEAQHEPFTYFNKNEADVILWPGYWGWTKEDTWSEEDKVHSNMKAWQTPLIQSNFSMNDLNDHRSSGPQGLSHVINSDNQLIYRGAHLEDEAFIVRVTKANNQAIITSCESLTKISY